MFLASAGHFKASVNGSDDFERFRRVEVFNAVRQMLPVSASFADQLCSLGTYPKRDWNRQVRKLNSRVIILKSFLFFDR